MPHEVIAIIAIVGLLIIACDDNRDDNKVITYAIGGTGPGGGIVFYDKGSVSDGWRYLEAAPTNQATSVAWSSTDVDVTGTGTAIGTGKANTAAIIAAFSSDTASNNAAKVAVAYSGGGKNDWFFPSKDELNEMYKAKTHLGISSGWFWSSSQYNFIYAWFQDFNYGSQDVDYRSNNVRAVRAF